jgi:Ribonuclease G/E
MPKERRLTERCPNCDGKGHVFDAVSLLVFPIGIIFAPFETKSPDGLTREQCSHCDGTGRVFIEY